MATTITPSWVMTYDSLTSMVLQYLERKDTAVVNAIPTFISLAEFEIAQEIKTLGQLQVAEATMSIGDAIVQKPARWRKTVSMNITVNGKKQPVLLRKYEYLRQYAPDPAQTGMPKYYADYEPNYVFNMDKQTPEKKFVIVCEGPFDAMAVDGVAVLSNECGEVQADIIDSLGREVIVVPDFDVKHVRGKEVWAGSKLVEQAIDYGWSVSFPIWNESAKDISEATQRFGRLFTLKAILDGQQTSRLKIELMRKRIHS